MASFRFQPLRVFGCMLLTLAALTPAVAQQNDEEFQKNAREYMKGSVAEDILKTARLEIASVSNFSTGSDAYGKHFILRVLPGQTPRNNAVNSEVAIDYPYQDGDTVRYSWRMKLPRYTFIADAPLNRWWLLARWNAQPNLKVGERQEDFNAKNPSIMIGFKQTESGKDNLYFSYGIPDSISAGSFPIKREEWIKFDVEVTWSKSSDKGKARIFVNNSKLPLYEVSGRNMYGKYHNLFRIGNFRNLSIQTEAAVFIGDVKVEKVQ